MQWELTAKLSPNCKLILKAITEDLENLSLKCQLNDPNLSIVSERQDYLGINLIDFKNKNQIMDGEDDRNVNGNQNLYDKDPLNLPIKATQKMKTNLKFLRFKCSGSDVIYLETDSIKTFKDTVKDNMVIVYVYGDRAQRVRL